MRLATRHPFAVRLRFAMIRLMSRRAVPDVLRTLFHRPEVFGRPFATLTHAVMRGPSDWSIGERELFAAFVSSLNRCRF